MSDKKTESGKLAEKIAKIIAEAEGQTEPYVFNEKEVNTLQAVIAFVEMLKALRAFGKIAMWIMVALGTIIVNWERVRLFLFGE